MSRSSEQMFTRLLDDLASAGATVVYCSRVTPTWLLVHVDLPMESRMRLAKTLNALAGKDRRVTVAEAT